MRSQISSPMRHKIRALRHIAQWTYRHIAEKTGISLSTVYRIAHPVSTPVPSQVRRCPIMLTPHLRSKLVNLATSTAANRRKPLAEIAFMAGIQANNRTLRRSFAEEGYHRRVARKKPFLKPQHKRVRSTFSLFFSSFFSPTRFSLHLLTISFSLFFFPFSSSSSISLISHGDIPYCIVSSLFPPQFWLA